MSDLRMDFEGFKETFKIGKIEKKFWRQNLNSKVQLNSTKFKNMVF